MVKHSSVTQHNTQRLCWVTESSRTYHRASHNRATLRDIPALRSRTTLPRDGPEGAYVHGGVINLFYKVVVEPDKCRLGYLWVDT